MKDISKVYRTDTVETHALRQFSLFVDEGEFVSVTGPSGSGKTTFLNIAGLLEECTGGTYELQSFNLIPELDVFDNVDVPLRYRGFDSKERARRIDNVLDIVGLGSRRKHLPSQLSGGQQQRVAIARALAGTPLFLLADEPTGNLDSHMADSVMDLLTEINSQGTTIIMVTHEASLAERAYRNIHVCDGQVSAAMPDLQLAAQMA
jgi:putative ABC transport system ATP-binding protein